MWLHNIADFGIFLAYLAIPFILVYLTKRRTDVPFRGIFLLFGAFIVFCGMTHLFEVVTSHIPIYRFSGLLKIGTALVSWATIVALIPMVPQMLLLRMPQDLMREIEKKEMMERELRASEEKTKSSLAEKSILLKEIHHRVKNNLQVICSLLELQRHYTENESSSAILQETKNRVRSMALVHERLYRAPDLSRIDFAEYVENLIGQLFTSYQTDGKAIAIRTNLTKLELSIDAAIPCGLLVNELFSNCLKHGFQGRTQGSIHIDLVSNDAQEAVLRIQDDGVGMPAEVSEKSAQSFGMQLVADLVDQLHGRMEIESKNGTSITISFPYRRTVTS